MIHKLIQFTDSLKISEIGSKKNSTSKAMYREMIEQIEKGTKLARFALVNLTGPGTILPALLVTLGNYFVYGLGDDSFFLPCPVMYDRVYRTTRATTIHQNLMIHFFITFISKVFHSTGRHQSAMRLN